MSDTARWSSLSESFDSTSICAPLGKKQWSRVMRFLTPPNLHLNSPLRSVALRDPDLACRLKTASREVLRRIVDVAIDRRVDGLLLAGDVFDNDVPDVAARTVLARALARLGAAGIPTLLIRGNHDGLLDPARYGPLGESVFILDEERPSVEIGEAVVHGLSHTGRAETRSFLPRYPRRVEGRGLMHCSPDGAPGHDPYAPCAVTDLHDHGYGCWSLGHIYVRQEWRRHRGLAIMASIPQGRHIREGRGGSVTAQELFPFPLRGVDFDNDGAFMNEPVVDWCWAQGLEVTRSRAYRKKDQAWVEQKNGAIVRRLVGYGRFEGPAATALLARLYAAARLHTNLFQPSFKLREKVRVGARVTKRWYAPVTPAETGHGIGTARCREHGAHPRPPQPRRSGDHAGSGAGGAGRVGQRGAAPAPKASTIIVDLMGSVAAAKRNGERLEIHRRPYRRVKPIPKRPSLLDPHRADIEDWLEAQPAMTAVEVLARLKQLHPDRFTDNHLRTVQRMVKSWRALEAKKIIHSATAALVLTADGRLR